MGRVKFGIRNVFYALIKQGESGIKYDTPKPLKGAVSLSISPEGDEVEEYADDSKWFSDKVNNGYKGSIELEVLPKEFCVDVLGQKIDSKGGLLETTDDSGKEFALLWEFQIGGDSKVRGKRSVLYRCTASRSEDSGTTKEKSIKPEHAKIDIVASGREKDSAVKYSCESDSELYANWFKAVTEPSAE